MQIKHKSTRLGTEPILPLLFRLSIPGIIAMTIQSLYNVVDSIYIGRLSTEALSALTLAFPIQLILIGISVGTGIGASSLIARLLGAGEREKATRVTEHVILISLLYGLIIALAGYFFSPHLLKLFTDEPELITMGSEYIRIIMLGSGTLFFPMICNNVMRGQGNTFLPMLTMLVGSICNIILDPLLIYGIWLFPRLEIAGAAYATVLSRLVSGLLQLYLIFSKYNELHPRFKHFRTDFTIIRQVYNVGLPAMFMQFLGSFMLMGMNRILGGFSTAAIAAAGIFFRLQSFIFLPIFGLTQGYMPVAGYNYGHKHPTRLKEVIKSAACIALVFGVVGFFLFQLFPRQLVLLFNRDPELILIGTVALRNVSLAFPIIGPAIIAESTFQALGRGVPSLILSLLRQIFLLLPLMYILGHYRGLDALWYAFPVAEIINALVAGIWIYSFLRRVFQKMEPQA